MWRNLLFFALACASPAWTEDPHATIATTKGEFVEGSFVSASNMEVVITVSGQALRIPTQNVKYISFMGKLEATTSAPLTGPASGSVDDAFKAFDEIRTATAVGLLRAQYADKLQQRLPRVMAFTKAPTGTSADVAVAMSFAARDYQDALDLSGWRGAPVKWARASRYVAYAKDLLHDKPDHVEDPNEKGISIGQTVMGRLGVGDQKLTKKLQDAFREGALSDVYRFRIDAPTKIVAKMKSTPCWPRLTLTDGAEERMDDDARLAKPQRSKRI